MRRLRRSFPIRKFRRTLRTSELWRACRVRRLEASRCSGQTQIFIERSQCRTQAFVMRRFTGAAIENDRRRQMALRIAETDRRLRAAVAEGVTRGVGAELIGHMRPVM